MAKKFISPTLSSQGKTPLKLNLGCGTDHREGWINIDAVPDVQPDLLHDLNQPLPFPGDSVSQILAQDILEHFTKEDAQKVIAEIGRVLEVGGTVEVRVPNVDEIIDRFVYYKETRNEFLYGTTQHTGIFGAHKVGYTPEMMVRFMMEHGLELRVLEPEETNFYFVFEKVSEAPTPRSLLVFGQLEKLASTVLEKTLQQLRQQDAEATLIEASGPKSYWRLFMTLLRQPPQLILLSRFWPQVLGTLFAMVIGIPVIWLEEKAEPEELNHWFKLPRFFYYLVKDSPEVVIIPSEQVKDRLTRRHVPLELLHVVTLGAKDSAAQLSKAVQRAFWKHEAERMVQKK